MCRAQRRSSASSGSYAAKILHSPSDTENRSAPPVQFPSLASDGSLFTRLPEGHGGDDPVDPIGGEEAVLDALLQAVGVDRRAEILVGVSVVVPEGRSRHAQLVGRIEVVED